MANRRYQDQKKVIGRQMMKLVKKAADIENKAEARRDSKGQPYKRMPMRLIKRLAKKYESLEATLDAILAYEKALEVTNV